MEGKEEEQRGREEEWMEEQRATRNDLV